MVPRQRHGGLKFKLLPLFLIFILGISLSFFAGWFMLLLVPLIKTSLLVSIAVVLLELVLSIRRKNKENHPQLLKLFLLGLFCTALFMVKKKYLIPKRGCLNRHCD